MLRLDVLFAERKVFENNRITDFEKVAEMYSFSSKRVRENELFLIPETVSSVNEMQKMVFRTAPVTPGSYMEVDPRNKRFLSSTVDSGFQSNATTRVPDRVELYEGNRLLSDEQIQRFISNTVLPHHRTLTNNKGGNWSQAQTDNRPLQTNFQSNHAARINMGGLLGQPVLQRNPVFISAPQEVEKVSQGRRVHFLDKPQGELTGFPGEFTVPKERQGFLVPQETFVNNFNIPLSTATQVVNSNQENISNPKCTSEGNSKYPTGMQKMTNCFPQVSQRENFRVPTMTSGDIIQIPQGNGVPLETEERFINSPQGTQSLSYGTMWLEETEDEIFLVHDGTPEEFDRVVKDTIQEIMNLTQGNNVPQETEEVIFNICPGNAAPQRVVVDTRAPGLTIPQEKVEETIAFPQGISIPQETVVETLAFPQGITIPQETVEEIFGNPQGVSVPQETFHEIMGIPQGITVPQGTLQELMGIPQGTQRQATLTPLQNENRYGGNSGLLFQEQQSLLKSQPATSSNVSAQHQSVAMASNNQLQKETGRSVVTAVNHGLELNTGNRRKRRRSSSSEAAFGKRQRLDLQTNGNREQSECLSGENRDAGKMVLPKRNSEDGEFFASTENCLELSSEASPCKFLDNKDSALLDSFPTKVIDDIYKSTFESDCFLTSGDDFITDTLVFLQQGMLDSLC